MRPLPVLSAAAAAALVVTTAGPATAATTVQAPAAGDATSTVVLGQVVAAGTDVVVGTVSLVSDTTGSTPLAKVVVTPLTLDGTGYGTQEVTPANSPQTVAAPGAGLPAGLGGFTAPAFTVTAEAPAAGPSTSAGASSLGSLSLLGLDVPFEGSVSAGSSVLGSGSTSGKAFEVRNLELPSVGDLLDELGLDLDLLGQIVPGVLAQIVEQLGLPVDPALLDELDQVLAAQVPVDEAQAAVDAKQAELDAATAQLEELNALQTDVTQAQAAVDEAQAAVDAVLGLSCTLLPQDPLCVALADAQAQLAAANAAVVAEIGEGADLATAISQAQALVDTLQGELDVLAATLADLLQDVLDLVATLPGIVAEILAQLEGVDLLSLDKMSVITSAQATSASPGGQKAEVVGGELVGLEVLGTDVLALPEISTLLGLGDGENGVDVGALVGANLTAVQEAIDGLLGTLTGLLDGAVPGLVVPALDVKVLERTTSTSITDGFGVATAGIGGLQVGIPAITVPDLTELLPAPVEVPALTAQRSHAGGDVQALAVSEPVTLTLGSLTENARFRPAVLVDSPSGGSGSDPVTNNRPLPRTGAASLVAVLGLALLAGAALVRRRQALPGTAAE